MRKPSTRAIAWAAAGVLGAVVTTLRIRAINGLHDQGYFEKYLTFARAAAAGVVDAKRLPEVSPAYAWLITLLHGQLRLDIVELRAVQIVALSLAAFAAAWAAENAGGAIAAVVAGIAVLASRAALINATDFEPETWILLLGALALVPLTRSQISVRGAAAAGLAMGLSATMRPSGLLVAIVILLWLAIVKARTQRAVTLSFAMAAATPVLLVLLVNVKLAGTPMMMDPGAVLYEGMNPLATGYSGVEARIVNDLEQDRSEDDALHITLRIVAARALGRSLSADEANRFWTQKAFAFARMHPMSAIELFAHKVVAAVSSYDAWDLATMVRKERELAMPAIPFAYLIALAMIGLWFGDRVRLAPVAIALLCSMVPLLAFYVTARQRNAAIPAVAILAGCGVAAAFRNRRALLAVCVALLAGALLTIETHAATEDRHLWAPASREAMLFDQTLQLERSHRWREAQQILLQLDAADYKPIRRNRTASSLAYHLARTQLRQRQADGVKTLVERARNEAPGDPDVLALSAMVDRAFAIEAERELTALHDPFTAELSRIRALIDVGRVGEAHRRGATLMRAMPEWKRPAGVLASW